MTDRIINIRDTGEYSDVCEEFMKIIKRKELNYVEALGCIETLKAQIFDAFCMED